MERAFAEANACYSGRVVEYVLEVDFDALEKEAQRVIKAVDEPKLEIPVPENTVRPGDTGERGGYNGLQGNEIPFDRNSPPHPSQRPNG
jgi:hypothetical protein